MNTALQRFLVSFLFLTVFFGFTGKVYGQLKDTILYDYNANGSGSCTICGSYYSCFTSDQKSFNGNSSYRISEIKIKVFHTSCGTGNFYAILNGDTLGSFYRSYSCSCNSCFIDSFTADYSKLSSYVANGNNQIWFGGLYTCTDRIMVIRSYSPSASNDVGVMSVDSPVRACPGSQKIKVTIANYGKNQVDSVKVHWTYNGAAQSIYSHTSLLDTFLGSGSNKASILLGNKTLTIGKTDTLKVWTSMPNGVSDTVNNNDTMVYFIRPSYGDTITVGGSSPNFTTIQAAINALQTNGLCKSVVVNIRPGSYNEQLVIGNIPGLDSLNSVTFRSSTGDSTDVIIYFNSTSSGSNYTLLLNNTKDITFKQLILQATGSNFGRVVEIRGTFLRLAFRNCMILGNTTTSTSSNRSLISHGTINAGTNRLIIIDKCVLQNGSSGVYWSTSTAAQDLRITNSVFTGQYYTNIYAYYIRNVIVHNNEITREAGTYSSGYGIYLYNNQYIKLTNNKILQSGGAYGGIYTESVNSNSSLRSLIANNFISVGYSGYVDAIAWYCYNSSYIDFYNNNTYTNTYYSYYNLILYYGSNIRLMNNSIFQEGPGRLIYLYYSGARNLVKSNYNNFYSKSTGPYFYSNADYPTLTNWQNSVKLDSFSTWGNPNYRSNSNLHLYSGTLNGNAIPDSRITTDIDGETRNTVKPDVGADEFNLVPVDAGLSGILAFKADSVCVEVMLKNNGADTLTSTDISWSVDGNSQNTYSWTGTLPSGETEKVCIGYYRFYDSATYHIMAWTEQPNNQTDTINYNDTFHRIGIPSLSGVYTIGGTAPDFSTFNEAVNAMVSGGIIDSVLFKVRNGTYSERIEIPSIIGATKKNAIVFESENKNSSLVILSYATNYSEYEVVFLNGTNWVSFRHMTIKSTSTDPSRAITISNGASNIIFANNILESGAVNSTDRYYNSVIFDDNIGNNLEIVNNRILKGATGIYADQNVDVTISGNTFENQYYRGLYLDYNTEFDIKGNTVNSNSTYSDYYSMYLNSLNGSNTISDNRFIGPNKSEYTSVYINSLVPSLNSDSNFIYNNFISTGGSNSSMALYINNCSNTYFIHNNINFSGTYSGTTYAAQFYNINNSFFYNNNFINSSGGVALVLQNSDNQKHDYNNFYSTGSTLAQIYYSNYSSIASLQAAGLDSNSTSLNPDFVSNTNLHIRNVLLNATAKKLHIPAKDIDSEARDSFVPDIGADEFVPVGRDVGVKGFIQPGEIIKADTTQVKVIVANYGLNPVYSFKVKCKINNDTLPSVTVSDTLASGDTIHVILGNYIFKKDSINNIAAWTYLPNGSSDQKPSNDTFRIINRRTAMSGVYTIGGSNPNFPTFNAAIDALLLNGVSDSVRFRVRAGTYTEQLRITPVAGANDYNAIIFESENLDSTSVTLQYNSIYYDTNYVVFFNGAVGFTFRKMTIKATGTSYSTVFLYENKAQYNILSNNYIKGNNTSSSNTENAVIGSFNGSVNDNYNNFSNNLVEGGSYGIYFYGYGAPDYQEHGLVIRNNHFLNQYYTGAFLYYQSGIVVDQNTFSSSSTYSSYYGINVYYLENGSRITSNQILRNNYGGYGIYLYGAYGNGDTILVANNMINSGGTNDPYGIYFYDCYYLHAVNNTVRIGPSTNSSSTCLYSYYGQYNELHNNVLENTGPGYALNLYPDYSVSISDHNNIRTAGTNLVYYYGNYYTTLAAYQSATLKDSNSLSENPLFMSSDDLHVRQISFNGMASPHPLVRTDIDKQLRDTLTPDIGADEFDPPAIDASVVEFINPKTSIKADTTEIRVVVRNMGTGTLTSVKINCKINNDTFPEITSNDTLFPGDTSHISVGYYIFKRDSVNNLTAWTILPNNTSDQNPFNDTFRIINKLTAMSGVYTIGGTSPDFPNFRSAIKAMGLAGIADGVRFRVRAGTYTEQLRIQPIEGAGLLNSVIFESSDLDSTSVTLQYSSIYSDSNYVVYFNGASGITFRNLSIKALGTSYSVVFRYENSARYNILGNNYIKGYSSSSTGSQNAVIISSNGSYADEYNEFNNNLIEGGSFGLYWYGYGVPNYNESGTRVINNRFLNQYYMGMYVYYQSSLVIERNAFTSTSTYSNYYGIYGINLYNKVRINANNIAINNNGSYGFGLYLQNLNGNGDTVLVANNMINLGGNSNPYGMYINSCYYVHVVNNTVRLGPTTNSSGLGIYINNGNTNRVFNNISENTGLGYAYYVPSQSAIFKSDYNNFRTAGTYPIYWNSANYATLAAFRASTQKDSHSLALDPQFISTSDIHIRQIGLNGKGMVYPNVRTDFDGEVRDSLKPDIGADEYNPPALDASLSEFLSPVGLILADTLPIKVVVRNLGLNTLTSLDLYCRVNSDTLFAISISDTIASGDTIHVIIGSYLFKRDSVNNLTAWTSNPNGGTDQNLINDTIRILKKKTSMSGVYTIGGSNPDFISFKAAIKEMNAVGIIGSVRFRVRSGTYNEQLRFQPIIGAGALNSVIFESEGLDSTLVTLQYNSVFYDSNYVVFFNGASGITFRKMKIRALHSTYSVVFLFENKAQYNILSNNQIVGNGSSSTGSNNAVIGSFNSSYSDDYNQIRNNVIEGGSIGIYWYGYGAPNYYENSNRITDNQFKNQYYMGMYLIYNNSIEIERNIFTSVSTYSTYYAIYGTYINNKVRIQSNLINLSNSSGYGIYLYSANGNSDTIVVANNMVNLGGSNSSNNIRFDYSSNIHIVNNTFRLGSSTPNTSSCIYLAGGSTNQLLNNIIENNGPGYCLDVSSSSEVTKSNRNNFRTAGYNVARWNGLNYTTLNALKAVSLKDTHSLTLDPLFYTTDNLHIRQLGLNGKASKYPLVKTDIDRQTRNVTTPDIGADEFNPPALDAGIFNIITPNKPFLSDTQYVVVVLKNHGLNTINTVKIDWRFNNATQSTFNWSGSLASNDSLHIRLAKKYFNADSAYSMKAWSSLPNSYNDTINYNDTFKVNNIYPALSGIYTIGGASPDFNTFTDAIDAMIRGGIVGQVTFNVRNGSYSEKVTIPKIAGAEKRNSIIFQSESLDSTKVTLINSFNTPGYNYTLWLQGAVGVTFKHMTIAATNSSYGIVAYINEGSSLNTFTNSILEGVSTTSTGDHMALVWSGISNSLNNNQNNFTNSVFKNGSYGIYANGNAGTNHDKNITIVNNTFDLPYYTGIYIYNQDTPTINNNRINVGSQANAFGIRMEQCIGGYKINNNAIVVPNGYMGIYIASSSGLASKPSLVSNNMVSVLGNGTNYGLYFGGTNYINIYNNNVHLNSTNASSYSMYISGSNIRSVNNIFDHSGAGFALYNSSGTFLESNYNNYRSNGSNLAYWSGNRANLSALKSANSMDIKSISIDPVYVSTTDLHVRAVNLDKAGKSLSDVRYDIDGTKRDSLLPDIGADEFRIPSPNDAGISAYIGPVTPFLPGSNVVKVVLNNYGSDTLKNAVIQWTMNGTAQSSYNWSGAIKTGASLTISIGSFNFSTGVKYTIAVWPVSPNGVTDTIGYNDTLKRTNIYSGLEGDYTIGGYLPDFNTFAEANLALMQRGVIDTVTFKVRNGTYNEQLEILPFPGSSPTKPVTFTSESGDSTKVLLQYNPQNYNLFHLKGADNVTISRMTLKCYGNPYYNNVVIFDNEATNITISNNRIISVPSAYHYYGYYGSGILSGTDKDNNAKILYNNITGDRGIQLYGAGTNSTQQESGLLIEGNKVDEFVGSGIILQYMNAPIIRSNSLTPLANTGGNMIYLTNMFNEMTISHNKLYGNISSYIGIYVNNHLGTSSRRGSIFNNFISMPNPSNYGLYLYNSAYCNVFYNSINLFSTSAYSSSSAIYLSLSTNLDLRNNILCNDAGGYAVRCDNVPTTSNYNDLYSNGSNLGQVGTTNYTSLASWKSGTSRDANSKSVFPTFFSNTDLHTTLINLDSAATPISGYTDDIDKNTRHATWPDIGADEFNSLPNNLAITAILNPVSGCMIDSQQLRVTIFNYGSLPQKDFPVRYSINGGAIFTQTFNDSILPGSSKTFNFNGKVNTKPVDNYNFKVWTDLTNEQYQLNDTIHSLIINYSIPDSVKIMTPVDSIKNLAFPISLSWQPSSGATLYDIYIWQDTAQRPSTAAYYGLTQIGHQIPSGLIYGETYNWQVLARNPFCSTFGRVQRFTVRELPDLTVTSVSLPATSFSGTTISVSWVVKNKGKGTTGSSYWYDILYLSNDQILDAVDPVLTGVTNAASLGPSQSYNNTTTVTLPNGIIGKYYVIVKTEAYNHFLESDEGNNISDDTAGMKTFLTPPPDLQVISVIKPGTAFSGQTINIQFTVKNNGTGITRTSNSWNDQVFLNEDSVIGGNLMRTTTRNGALDVDSTYKVNTTITLPFELSGGHYIIVNTDASNRVFEHATENNNHRISDSIKIIQTPPPDLIVRNVQIKDTVSNRQTVALKYDLINQGGSATTKAWTDYVFISRFSTFNPATSTHLYSFSRSNIDTDDTLFASNNIVIPDDLNGLFYLYVATDYGNTQYEGTKDTNNLSPKRAVRIHTPDLVVSSVSIPDADTSGKFILVDWKVKNIGQGINNGGIREDKIFISSHSPFNLDSVILIDSVRYNATILPGDSLSKSHYARIPNGIYGRHYVYVYTDIQDQIYENLLDTNNYRRSSGIDITLAPYPDLRAISFTVPDTSEADMPLTIGYKVENKGNFRATATWNDKILISKDSVYSPDKVVLLQTNTLIDSLSVDSSYEFSQIIQMPNNISEGNYYFFVFTDAGNSLYEYLYESNNIRRSPRIFVKGYPPIDLTVISSTIPDTIYSGTVGNFGYEVKNIGEAKTISNGWSDNLTLSLDTLLDPTDYAIGEVQVYMTLDKDETYQRNIQFAVPNGLSGDYYVFFETDYKRDNLDVDTINNIKIARDINGLPKKMLINLSLSPDLEMTSWDIPSTATAGQPASFSWKVDNVGDTITKSGSWTDGIYLSSDYTIDHQDIFLGYYNHKGNINKGASYNASANLFIPNNVSGNYVILIRTDNADREYEYLAEDNNIGASAITISIAPPGDLVVTAINSPANAAAGDKVTVSYAIRNIGSNPINGVRTDNVYLSEDTLLDGTDVLFATKTESASLIPGGTRNLSVSENIKGIKTGEYYFLVFTDVRNNISETKDTNNIMYGDLIDVNIPELPMKVLTPDTLIRNKELYYRLIIPDSLNGESILITLKGDSITGNNEIYTKFDDVPTRSDFDYGFTVPYYGNQEILIHTAQAGTYYIMVYGTSPTGIKQNITLFAKKLNFEIRKVNPVKGGNTGQVTVRIEGAKFDEETAFELSDPNAENIIKSSQMPDSSLFRYDGTYHGAKSITIVNPTLAFVTFDLKNQLIGKYDVVASKEDGNLKVKLEKGFEIVPGSPPDIQIAVNSPSAIRGSVLTSFDVMFTNLGNTDMVNGYLQVISNAGAPVSFTVAGISNRATSLLIPLEEFDGVKGLLRPGADGTITVYTFSSISMAFNVILIK